MCSGASVESHPISQEGCKELLFHLPADVLNAPFTLLPELHISLDSLLQIQDRGILHYNHSCNQGHRWEEDPCGKPQSQPQMAGEKPKSPVKSWQGEHGPLVSH